MYNKFAVLDTEEQQKETTDSMDRTPKPSPIYVDRVSNIQPLMDLLNKIAKDEHLIKVLRNEEVKIQPKIS